MTVKPPIQRGKWLLPVLLLALPVAMLGALLAGSVAIAPAEVLHRLAALVSGAAADDAVSRILFSARLPRVLLSLSVGAALALSGLAAQTLFRNPLASPSVIGVSSGSAFGAVCGMLLAGRLGVSSAAIVTGLSIAGGLAVTALTFGLGSRGSGFGHTLLLAGLAVGGLCSSLTTGALYLAGERLQAIVFWLMGGLWQANWRDVWLLLPLVLVAFVTLWLSAAGMNVALLGDRAARDLGLNVARLRIVLLLVIATATAVAVSVSGVIGFVGLIVPHLLRLAVGADHRRLVPVTALGGALLLLGADTLARTLASPAEIPVGIFTAILGAPFFLWLLQKRRSVETP